MRGKIATGRLPIIALLALAITVFAYHAPLSAQTPVTVTYTASTEIFPNPDRGVATMYTYGNDGNSTDLTLLSQSTLASERNGDDKMSLAFRHVYLKDFIDADISEAYLNNLVTDLATARAAGVKLILRFSYSANNNDDATPARALGHIAQLGPVLQANEDVISVIQFGFVGQWGEWWSSDEYPSGGLDPQDRTTAAPLVEALANALDGIDENISFSLRSPSYRTQVFGVLGVNPSVSAGDISSYGESVGLSERTGFHNDCLESGSDAYQGFYSGADRTLESANGPYTATGGETCFPEGGYSSPTCSAILSYANTYGLDYIGRDWYTTFEEDMIAGGCWDDLLRDLGYRWRLVSATFPEEIVVGEDLDISLELVNDGYGAIYNNKIVRLVLRSSEDASETLLTLPELNPRLWIHGTHSLETSVAIPSGLDSGEYDLLLQISDDTASTPAYAIRLANDGLWESSTGYNDLDYSLQINSVPPDGDEEEDGEEEIDDEEDDRCEEVANVNLSAGDTFSVVISGTTACSGYSQLQTIGTVTLGDSALAVSFVGDYRPPAGTQFVIIANDGSATINGTFAGLPEGARYNVGGAVLQITYRGGDGNDAVLSAVSVPATPNTGIANIGAIPRALLAVTLLTSVFILWTADRTVKVRQTAER